LPSTFAFSRLRRPNGNLSDRVVGMLDEVGGFFVDESIRIFFKGQGRNTSDINTTEFILSH
jgi:hypothetical protein